MNIKDSSNKMSLNKKQKLKSMNKLHQGDPKFDDMLNFRQTYKLINLTSKAKSSIKQINPIPPSKLNKKYSQKVQIGQKFPGIAIKNTISCDNYNDFDDMMLKERLIQSSKNTAILDSLIKILKTEETKNHFFPKKKREISRKIYTEVEQEDKFFQQKQFKRSQRPKIIENQITKLIITDDKISKRRLFSEQRPRKKYFDMSTEFQVEDNLGNITFYKNRTNSTAAQKKQPFSKLQDSKSNQYLNQTPKFLHFNEFLPK